MKSLNDFLSNTNKKWYSRRISDEHRCFLMAQFPMYDINDQIKLYKMGAVNQPVCAVCGGKLNKLTAKTCSLTCRETLNSSSGSRNASQIKAKITNLQRYGVENPAQSPLVQKRRLSSLVDKYGGHTSPKSRESASARSIEFQKKSKQTLLDKYGVDNPSQIPGHSERCKDTLLKKHGVTHYYNSDEFKLKSKNRHEKNWQTMLSPIATILNIEHIISMTHYNPNDRITFSCNECGNIETLPSETLKWRFLNTGTPCQQCSKINKGSLAEQSIATWLESFTTVTRNSRQLISPLEIDIFLPIYNLAVEYNGLFWHNSLRVGKNYHVNKTNQCIEKGIRLIHIFEDEWIHRQNIVKSRLSAALGKFDKRIYARKCEIKKINSKEANKFINENHIQGSGRANLHYGLYYDNELVSVMTFLKGDLSKKILGWELNRFCCKLNYSVVGGASRLFSAFIKEIDPDAVTSFADRRWCEIEPVYKKLGFQFISNTIPNYWYFNSKELKRLHRFSYRSKNNISEADQTRELLQIYDCGSSKWMWFKEKAA